MPGVEKTATGVLVDVAGDVVRDCVATTPGARWAPIEPRRLGSAASEAESSSRFPVDVARGAAMIACARGP